MLPDALIPIAVDAHKAAVLVDYDGTLSPIVDDPNDAVPLPAARAALGALTGELAMVAVISGRPVQFLRDALALDGIAYVGQYGLERLDGDTVVADPRVGPYRDAVARAAAAAELAFPDLYVERKGSIAVTLHWRTAPDRAEAAHAWVAAAARREGLDVLPARMAAELRPPVSMDKGQALVALMTGPRSAGFEAGVQAALFAGDDYGDLSAFGALRELRASNVLQAAACVAVRSAEAPEQLLGDADVIVDGPPGVAALLGELGEAIRHERG